MLCVKHQILKLRLRTNSCVAELVPNFIGFDLEARAMKQWPEASFGIGSFDNPLVLVDSGRKLLGRCQFVIPDCFLGLVLLLFNHPVNDVD